jgi:hypothetical protein
MVPGKDGEYVPFGIIVLTVTTGCFVSGTR